MKVQVRIGDPVDEGQPLIGMESSEAEAAQSAFAQAGASQRQANAGLAKAKRDLERANDLFSNDATAKKEVFNVTNALAQAEGTVAQADAMRKESLIKLQVLRLNPGESGQHITVCSPLSGEILDMSIAAGDYRKGTDAPVISVAELSAVWMTSEVPVNAIRLVNFGKNVDKVLLVFIYEGS